MGIHFDFTLLLNRIFNPEAAFWRALWTTIYIAVIAQTIGVFLGLATALAAKSRRVILRLVAVAYSLVIRGTPLIVQVFFIYFGANLFFGFNVFPRSVEIWGYGISGAVLAGIVGLAINEGAYMSEIIRAGIESVDAGQMEAALSVGMTYRVAMRRIVLPQAARFVIPPLGNEFNGMLKSTSLLAFIGVYELFQDAQVHYSTNFQPVEIFAGVAFWYFVLTSIWSIIQMKIEKRFSVSDARHETGGVFSRLLGLQPRLERR